MTSTIESISAKLKNYFSGKSLNFSEEDYTLCRKLYGNVSASRNNILYTSISLDTTEDLEYYKNISIGDTITLKDSIFFATPHAIPNDYQDIISDKNDHHITHTLLSNNARKHKNGKYGNVIIGAKFKWNNVLFTPYTTNNSTNSEFEVPVDELKKLNKFILDGDVKVGFIKILPYKNINNTIQDIINSFESFADIDGLTSSHILHTLSKQVYKENINHDIIQKIKIGVFTKLIKNNQDFIKFLKMKNCFINIKDVIELKWVEELIVNHISYKITPGVHSKSDMYDTLDFYYDDIKISEFSTAGNTLYDFIVKKEIYIKAAFEYLEKCEPGEIIDRDIFKKRMYMYSFDYRGPVYVLGELLTNHSKINFKRLRTSQGYKNIKESINVFDDVINDINEKFELVYKKQITFDDFYKENSVIVDNVVEAVQSGGGQSIAKYGNTDIHTKFVQNMYHLYPPSGIVGKSEEAALKEKRNYLPKVMEFLTRVNEFKRHLKL